MSRRRYISTEMSYDTKLRDLAKTAGEVAVLFYTWMIPHSEDDGILQGDVETILARVFPLWRWVTVEQAEVALSSMNKLGLIEWDQTINEVRFPAEKFYKYQTYVKPERRRTPQNIEILGNSTQNIATHTHTPTHSQSHSLTPTPTETMASLVSYWNDNCYVCGGTEGEVISEALEKFEPALIHKAMEICVGNNKRTLRYFEGILRQWDKKGIYTLERYSQVESQKKASEGRQAQPQPAPYYRKAEDILRERGQLE